MAKQTDGKRTDSIHEFPSRKKLGDPLGRPFYSETNSSCFCECTPARFACIDHGPVHVTVTGRSLPFKFSSDWTKTSLFVGVRPFQRFFTLSSNNTSTVWPRYFLLISVT